MLRVAVAGLVLLGAAGARAQTCQETLGAERARVLVDQCLEVSPATHPPCNALNACELILGEVKRGCAMLDDQGRPPFCKPYLAGAGFVPPAPPRHQPGFDCAKAASAVERTICASDGLAQADRAMTDKFAAAVKASPDAAALRQDQRGFLQERAHCADPEPGRSADQVRRLVGGCIYDLTAYRADELAALAGGKAASLWDEFSTADGECSVRYGHDGSDAVEIERQKGKPDALAVRFSEFVFREPAVLQAGDRASFDVDGKAFAAAVSVKTDAGGDTAEIVAAPASRAPLLDAMASGRMLRVKRNGKTILRAPLAGFAAADAKARQDCGG